METGLVVTRVKELLQDYLDGKLSGKDMVLQFDSFIVENIKWDWTDPRVNKLDELQYDLAFYVENSVWRNEHPEDYYGPEELRAKVLKFLADIDA